MIKTLVAAATLAFTAAGPVLAQDLPRTPLEVPQAFERLFNASDVDGLLRLYGPGSVFVPSPGVQLREPAQIRGALSQFLSARMPIQLTVRQVYESQHTALIVFDWVMSGPGSDGKPARMAGTGADVVARQPDGTWLYAVDNPFGVAAPAAKP